MSVRSLIRLAILSVAVLSVAPTYAAEDSTVHQVYLAAEAGRFEEAQAMMDKVLIDHPNSGKAHFVEAELLAKQGRIAQAQAELATAERLAPGLTFAKPLAVQHLRTRLATPVSTARANAPAYMQQAPAASSVPWGLVLGGVALIAFIWLAVRFMSQRAAPNYAPGAVGPGSMGPGGMGNHGFGASAGGAPYAGGGAQAAPMMGPSGGGMGSGLMGSLATGAALGAGLVAGEALMHRFTDSNRSNNSFDQAPQQRDDRSPAPDDTDFGVSDNSSWDDGGSGGGGGDDWN